MTNEPNYNVSTINSLQKELGDKGESMFNNQNIKKNETMNLTMK